MTRPTGAEWAVTSLRHPQQKGEKALLFIDRETEVQRAERFVQLGSHSTERRAETVENAVQEIRAPNGKAKAGSGAWVRSVEAVRGERVAHKAVSFSSAGIYGKFLAWLLWTDGMLGLWQKINTYLLTS